MQTASGCSDSVESKFARGLCSFLRRETSIVFGYVKLPAWIGVPTARYAKVIHICSVTTFHLTHNPVQHQETFRPRCIRHC